MANLFGSGSPTIYLNGSTAVALPLPDKDGKIQRFDQLVKSWPDPERTIQERVEGFRLFARYNFGELTSAERESLLSIINNRRPKFIKFSTFAQRFAIVISDFEPGLLYGYDSGDSAFIEFTGKYVLPKHPNEDDEYNLIGGSGTTWGNYVAP